MVETLADNLLTRIDNRTVVIGVIGLGYMGLPLAIAAAEAGLKTIGFDVDEDKPKQLHAGAETRNAGVARADRTDRKGMTLRKAA